MTDFGNVRDYKADNPLDCYETPEIAIKSLWIKEDIPNIVWEPCCGPGAIVNFLRGQGITVIASDIKDYGCPDSSVKDFFEIKKAETPCMVINPPFRTADKFVRHGFNIGIVTGKQIGRAHV